MDKIKSWVFIGAPFTLAIILSLGLQLTVLAKPEEMRLWLVSFGPLIVVVYALIQTLTIVVAPLGGNFIWIAIMAVLGPAKGLVLAYFVTTPAYFINFYLAKRYGQRVVKRLVGEKALLKINHLVKDAGIESAWILKIFQGGYFDFGAYALGLSSMSWKQFTKINVIGGIPSALLYFIILTTIPNFTLAIGAIQVVAGIFIIVSIIWHHRKKKHK